MEGQTTGGAGAQGSLELYTTEAKWAVFAAHFANRTLPATDQGSNDPGAFRRGSAEHIRLEDRLVRRMSAGLEAGHLTCRVLGQKDRRIEDRPR